MIKIAQKQFKQMGFTHFFVFEDGSTSCFVLDTCENCGSHIQAANSIGGSSEDVYFYLSIGMEQIWELPSEGYYSEEINGEACHNCNG